MSSTKRKNSGSTLKQGWFANTVAPTATSAASSKIFNHEQVYYEARLDLRGNNKYAVYVRQIGLLSENILVDPTAIMHASVELDNTKPLGSKSEMNKT